MPLLAYELSRTNASQVDDGIRRAPRYTVYSRRVVEHAIKSIHSIPKLWTGVSAKEIEVYIGRSADDGVLVNRRWQDHRANRRHQFGMVICRVPTDMVQVLEGMAIRILKGLRDRGRLCVANIDTGSNGPLPSTADATLYLTWRINATQSISLATKADVEDIAAEVVDHTPFQEGELASMLDVVRHPREFAEAEWHPDHG